MNDSEHWDARVEDGAVSDTGNMRGNDLSPAWALAGAGLFAIAIAAPVYVVDLSDALKRSSEPATPAKVQVTERTEAESGKTPPTMIERLAASVIDPGVGIGPLSLGQDLDVAAARLPLHSWQSFRSDGDRLIRQLGFDFAGGELLIEGETDTGRVDTLSLSMSDCDGIANRELGLEGLPLTPDGLSIGSHRSRVIARLGQPLRGAPLAPIPGPMSQPTEQVHAGITFAFCPETDLAKMVRVERTDDYRHDIAPMVSIAPALSVSIPSPTEASVTADGLAVTYSARGLANDGLTYSDALEAVQFHAGMPDPVLSPHHPAVPAATNIPQEIAPLARYDLSDVPRHRAADTPMQRRVSPGQSIALGQVPSLKLAGFVEPVAPQTNQQKDAAPQPSTPLSPRDLPPAASKLADRGLIVVTQETAAPVLAQAPKRPDAAVHGAAPSRLAGIGIAQDKTDPLSLISPGAALPDARTTPQSSLAAAPPRATGPSIDRRPGDVVIPKAPVLARIVPAQAPSAVDAQKILVAALDPAVAEAEMELSRATRRGLQRRLALIGYDSGGIDGIFGPKTRTAIADFQVAENLQPTGFIDTELKEIIENRSRARYSKWQAVQRQRARERREQASRPIVAAMRVPKARKIPECLRDESGRIARNQSVSCDITFLKEDLRALFGGSS